ncbi:MAG: HlyC/CorC family transporter [Rhodospirillales bacterium]|nr:HlyC/CorC family transporter [Rhodospirillales bacterium]MBO6787552.1 HlyC/CorC family transporter [Rhodospirillales bacterium]
MKDSNGFDEPPSPNGDSNENGAKSQNFSDRIRIWVRNIKRMSGSNGSARDTLDELIDEREESELPLDPDERLLVANILELRNLTIYDVMVPRADIVAIPINASLQEVIDVATREGHSRLPIYTETLDDAQGMVHIKDVLGFRGNDAAFKLEKVQRRLLFVAPSMRVLELLLEMRVKRSHMALVVDEFGGVDGLVTIEDLVEEIVGEIDDEHDNDDEPKMEHRRDGSWVADARIELKTFEERFGYHFGEEEHEDIDTLGGLVFSIAGRVPIRGEIVSLPDGTEFEILDADPRRIHRVRIRRGKPAGEPANPAGVA